MAKIQWESKDDVDLKSEVARVEATNEQKLEAVMYGVRNLINPEELSEAQYDTMVYLYPTWESRIGETVENGEVVLYNEELYRALDSKKVEHHLNPVDANYLFVRIPPKDTIEEWESRDYRNPYQIGDKVFFKGGTYELAKGGNAYAYPPLAVKGDWVLIEGEQDTEDKEEEEESEKIGEWIQPGWDNPYMVGDKVEWRGSIYTCRVDKTTHNPTDAPENWTLSE